MHVGRPSTTVVGRSPTKSPENIQLESSTVQSQAKSLHGKRRRGDHVSLSHQLLGWQSGQWLVKRGIILQAAEWNVATGQARESAPGPDDLSRPPNWPRSPSQAREAA